MRDCQWVVDTWVLETAENLQDERSIGALHFLFQLLENHRVAVDVEGEIIKEYMDHIKPLTHVAKWWGLIWGRGKIYYYSKSLNKQPSDHLLQKLRFDPSDIKFVAVAAKSTDKFLVSEDSDYDQRVQQYLQQQLGITVFSVSDALAKAKDP